LIGLITARRKKEAALTVSIIVLVFLSLYLGVCVYAREMNAKRLAEFAKERSFDVKRSSVYPRPFAPFFWMGVIETKDSFYKLNLDLAYDDIWDFQEIPKPKDNYFIELAKRLDAVKLYLWFADFPVATYENEHKDHIVAFYDLRFSLIPYRTPFRLKVVFDEKGSLRNISLDGRFVKERL
jgi:hypothetical protein